MGKSLSVVPITMHQANKFVEDYHRHNKPVRGARFCIGALSDKFLTGVAIVGRPVSRRIDDGVTAEITRLCANSASPKNTCSFLYARCWRIWQQMGGERMVTYTLQSESGSSLKGAGWKIMGDVKPRTKNTGWQTRHDRDWQDVYEQLKFRWEPCYG